MLSVSNRLTSFENFPRGNKQTSPFLLVYLSFSQVYTPAQFGIIVSKKYSKKAVERNRIKRLIREGIKKELKNITTPLGVIIIPKTTCLKVTQGQIDKDLATLLKAR